MTVYIITEEQLRAIERDDYPELVCKEIRSHPAPSPQNPCIEQGCDDIDNCDEICEHSRIYSPAWVKQHDTTIRNSTLDEMIKLSMMIEENETERWESVGRPKNDGYINGSHSGYGHALRDMRQWIDRIKQANGGFTKFYQ